MIQFVTTSDLFNLIASFLILNDYFKTIDVQIKIYNNLYNNPNYDALIINKLNFTNIFINDFIYLLKKNKILYNKNLRNNLLIYLKNNSKVEFINEVNKNVVFNFYDTKFYKDIQTSCIFTNKVSRLNEYMCTDQFQKYLENLIIYLYEILLPNNNAVNLQIKKYSQINTIINILYKCNFVLMLFIFVIYFVFKVL